MGIVNFVIEHKAVILGIAFLCSEILAYIPSVKANSVFQMIAGLLKKEHDAETAAVEAPKA